jgi:deoxyribonuclease IV
MSSALGVLSPALRNPVGTHHVKVGRGLVEEIPFNELLAHPAIAGAPLILETPGSRDPGDAQIPMPKRLRADVHGSDAALAG